jgi:UDP-glucose 6-dehydrogenase
VVAQRDLLKRLRSLSAAAPVKRFAVRQLKTARRDSARVASFPFVFPENLENVTFCNNAYACAKGAHALVIVTEWEQFRALDLKEMASIMASSVVVDLRNIYSPEEVMRHGFQYCGVGRPKSLAY